MAFSEKCVWCGEDVSMRISWRTLLGFKDEMDICDECHAGLVPITGELCLKCGRPLAKLNVNYVQDHCCSDCMRWKTSGWGEVLVNNKSFFEYNDFLKRILALYKFRGDVEVGRVFSSKFQKELKKAYRNMDMVIPIPSSRERLYERGFNQCHVWIEGTKYDQQHFLRRIKHEEKQSKKSRNKRMNRTEEMFDVSSHIDMRGGKVLLIDDLYTTGATIHYAAKALKLSGASEVYSLTLCRG